MKRIIQICILLLTIGDVLSHGQSRAAQSSEDAELSKAVETYYAAFYRGDVETVKRMTRDDYLQTDVNGYVQDKAAWLAEYYMPIAARIKAGLNLDEPASSDVQVRRYGSVAVRVGRTTLKSNVVSGKSTPVDLRFTQVWVKSHGKWQRAVYQNSWAATPPPPRANQ
jgi:ketosteroid isomerase-like protein